MQATKKNLYDFVSPPAQYQIPLFQRKYTWIKDNWSRLWEDIIKPIQLSDKSIQTSDKSIQTSDKSIQTFEESAYFLGVFVTVKQTTSHILIIDGQQRLTTILILLAAIRNKTSHQMSMFEDSNDTLVKINNCLTNPHYKNDHSDYFRLLPSQSDRVVFKEIMNQNSSKYERSDHLLRKAYKFFFDSLKKIEISDVLKITEILFKWELVHIMLDETSNYYVVYESLNSKGQLLTQADLIKNHFFLQLPNHREELYEKYWKRLDDALPQDPKKAKDGLTEYLKYFFMQKHETVIGEKSLFIAYKKETKDSVHVMEYLQELIKFFVYYEKILYPKKENNEQIQERLQYLNRIGSTNAYPLLLICYDSYALNRLNTDEFLEILSVVENFIIRRFICNDSALNHTHTFTKKAIKGIKQLAHKELVNTIKINLTKADYPNDAEFKKRFAERKFDTDDYGNKIRYILERLENHLGGQMENSSKLTIEHILPQNNPPKHWWKEHLGEQWEVIMKQYVNTIGNLTLTSVNSSLAEKEFDAKQDLLLKEKNRPKLNDYFERISEWKSDNIVKRTEYLTELALQIWKYFGETNS